MRLNSESMASEVATALHELPSFLQSLNLPNEVSALVGSIQQDGSSLNVSTNFSGTPCNLDVQAGVPQFFTNQLLAARNYYVRAQILHQALLPHVSSSLNAKGELELTQGQSLNAAQFLYALVSSPEHVCVVNNADPVIMPYFTQDFYHQQVCAQPLNYSQPLSTVAAMVGSALGVTEEAQAAGPAGESPDGILGYTSATTTNAKKADAELSPPSDVAVAPMMGLNDNKPQDHDAAKGVGSLGLNNASQDPRAAGTAGAAGAVGATATAGAAARFGGCLLPALLLLLLLGALAYYFLKLYPWPFVKDDLYGPKIEALNAQLVEDEANLDKINQLIKDTQEKLDEAYAQDKALHLEALKETLDKDQKTLSEVERLMSLLGDKEQQLLTEQQKAQEEALAKAKAAADKAAAAAAAANKPAPLPKCETIIKQGKMPNLIIATDGSGSMIQLLPDNTMRIEAAIKAAHGLVDSVDKNVPIHLFGIQGCPLARDYGSFSGSERAKLKRAINQTSPFNVRGMLPIEVTTPLVSAMRGMASAAPKNAPSIGVLISDGVDTCSHTEDLDLCSVAREIHKQRPQLSIHVVLIGNDAPNAKCVADITGGKVYRPNNTNELIRNLKNAGKSLQKVCH